MNFLKFLFNWTLILSPWLISFFIKIEEPFITLRNIFGAAIPCGLFLWIYSDEKSQKKSAEKMLVLSILFHGERSDQHLSYIFSSNQVRSILKELEKEALISSKPDPEGNGKWYSLTEMGRPMIETRLRC